MLASRVIPVVLCRNRQQVKGQYFNNSRVVGHALQACRVHAARNCDEVMLLDVYATEEGRTIEMAMVEELTQDLFVPCTIGGGIRTLDQIKDLLRAGADKVLIGDAAYRDATFVEDAAGMFGSQAIVVTVDHQARSADRAECIWRAQYFASIGAGEILLNNIDRDGTMQGYDLDLIREVCAAVSIPVIAAGGFGEPEHALQAVRAGASAVGIGAALQFSDLTPKQISEYLKQQGIEVRL